MKIINCSPGLISIPPVHWGAIEKLIWEIHKEFELRGHTSIITYDVPSVYEPGDIVIVHMANQALEMASKQIPYYFWMNDHHVVLGGKHSYCFQNNYNAIQKSIKSFVSAKFLVEYFGLSNVSYLQLGVNSRIYHPQIVPTHAKRLLCVGNTGNQFDPNHDRKGFGLAIQTARSLNWPITIAGPTNNNKNFFEIHKPVDVDLTVLYDYTEEQLVKLYGEHRIFIHPSDLEGGQPNLTLLEALSCGLPIVGMGFEPLKGMKITNSDLVLSSFYSSILKFCLFLFTFS